MATGESLIDDLARLMTGAAAAMEGAGAEMKTAVRAQGEKLASELDLATREDVEILKAMILELREEVKNLREKLG